MYQKSTPEQLNFPDFYLPFGGKLNPKEARQNKLLNFS
jgi:hypothetical protein